MRKTAGTPAHGYEDKSIKICERTFFEKKVLSRSLPKALGQMDVSYSYRRTYLPMTFGTIAARTAVSTISGIM